MMAIIVLGIVSRIVVQPDQWQLTPRGAARQSRRAAAVFLVVIALDQLTKHTLGTWIKPGQVRHVIPGVTFVYERNTGVAFSFLAGTAHWSTS